MKQAGLAIVFLDDSFHFFPVMPVEAVQIMNRADPAVAGIGTGADFRTDIIGQLLMFRAKTIFPSVLMAAVQADHGQKHLFLVLPAVTKQGHFFTAFPAKSILSRLDT